MSEIIEYLKGPGLIVMVLLLGVMGVLSLSGTLDSEGLLDQNEMLLDEIAIKKNRLDLLEKKISQASQELEEQDAALEELAKLDDLRLRALEIKQGNEVLRTKVASLEKGLEEVYDMFESYKDRYREAVRKSAVGTELESLTLMDGTVYREVSIRSIDALGMNIMHKRGTRRIPYKQLPEEMQQRFQFDAEQADAKLRAERERQLQSRLAGQQADEAAALRQVGRKRDLERQKAERLEESIEELEEAIRAIDRKLVTARRNLGRQSSKSISGAPQYRREIQGLEELKQKCQEQLRELRQMR
ncbi:MAG: hypothetical protein R3242_00890 [Akkermansiaceae bacterium]|nr:hypothetical protein [Akkermansiaceae bacterium]